MSSSVGLHKLLHEYASQAKKTNRLQGSIVPLSLGLFGEVGSVLAAFKKNRREKNTPSHPSNLQEELGDTLWYFVALCTETSINCSDFLRAYESDTSCLDLNKLLFRLGHEVASLLNLKNPKSSATTSALQNFFNVYMRVLEKTGIKLEDVISSNQAKVTGRFSDLDLASDDFPAFDDGFSEDEMIPKEFEVKFLKRAGKKCRMQMNGVFLGPPLDDNIAPSDGYRFHDIFHLSYATILHWSPVLRKLMWRKRKSNPRVDDTEDSGRAAVIEEGISVWIFSQAKNQGYFEGLESLPFGLLKVVKGFVQGYEVEACPLNLWEHAILEGYKVFRKMKTKGEGIVVCNRVNRSISYKPL